MVQRGPCKESTAVDDQPLDLSILDLDLYFLPQLALMTPSHRRALAVSYILPHARTRRAGARRRAATQPHYACVHAATAAVGSSWELPTARPSRREWGENAGGFCRTPATVASKLRGSAERPATTDRIASPAVAVHV